MRVGDDHDLGEDVVERLDVGLPVAGDPCDGLVLGQLEVQAEQVADVALGPVRVGAGEERGELGTLAVQRASWVAKAAWSPALAAATRSTAIRMCSLSRSGQLVAGGVTVEPRDGGADVLLVAQQAARGGIGVGRPRDRGDDVLAGPDDVVGRGASTATRSQDSSPRHSAGR